MRENRRNAARRILDEELRPFRQAGRVKDPTGGLLRAIRQALGVPVEEIAREMNVSRSLVFDLEAREREGRILMLSLERMSRAMGCRVVYGIVPLRGRSLEDLATMRYWEKQDSLDSDQGSGVCDQRSGGTR